MPVDRVRRRGVRHRRPLVPLAASGGDGSDRGADERPVVSPTARRQGVFRRVPRSTIRSSSISTSCGTGRWMDDCRRMLPASGAAVSAENFEDWIVQRFGAGVAQHFMLPYNRKLWARDLRRMSCEWVGERIADGDGDRPPADARTRRPLQSQSEVGYPAEGGFAGDLQGDGAPLRPDRIRSGAQPDRSGGADRAHRRRKGVAVAAAGLHHARPGAAAGDRRLSPGPDRRGRPAGVRLAQGPADPGGPGPEGSAAARLRAADPATPPHKVAFNHTLLCAA